MTSSNLSPPLLEVLERYSLMNPAPSEEFYRLRPQEIVPPFDNALVEQAVRHFMAHHRPWLPYAKPREDYGRLWTARICDDGYQLMQEDADGGDPFEEAEAWIGEVTEATYEVLTGKRPLSPEDDNVVAGVVETHIESFSEELAWYREKGSPIPAEVFDAWDELTDETQRQWMIAHYQAHPEDIGDLYDLVADHAGSSMPDAIDPYAAPAEILGEGVMTFPIGLVEVIRNAGMLGDATLVLVRPQVALTFLQVWLDDQDADVRIELA